MKGLQLGPLYGTLRLPPKAFLELSIEEIDRICSEAGIVCTYELVAPHTYKVVREASREQIEALWTYARTRGGIYEELVGEECRAALNGKPWRSLLFCSDEVARKGIITS